MQNNTWRPWVSENVIRNKTEAWGSDRTVRPLVENSLDSTASNGLGEIDSSDGALWAPETGRVLDGKMTVGVVHDDLGVINVFFKRDRNSVALKCLNINSDEYVANIIVSSIEKMYPDKAVRVEYYGQYQRSIVVDKGTIGADVVDLAMSVILEEPIMARNRQYRDRAYALIDEAVSSIKED